METTDLNSPDEQQNNLPEPGIDTTLKKDIKEQEDHPETGGETQTGAATDYTDPDNKPKDLSDLDDVKEEAEGDGDDSLTSDIA